MSPASSQMFSDDELSVGRSSATGSLDSRSKLRPKRRAPKPPVPAGPIENGDGSKMPTPIKPTKPAPESPSKSHSTPKHRMISDVIGPGGDCKPSAPALNNFSNIPITVTPDQSFDNGQKPILPKRFVKPKIIKIPRKILSTRKASCAGNQGMRSPPPARPDPPKNLPEKYRLMSSPCSTPETNGNDEVFFQSQQSDSMIDTSVYNTDVSMSVSKDPVQNVSEYNDTFNSVTPQTAVTSGLDYDVTQDSVDDVVDTLDGGTLKFTPTVVMDHSSHSDNQPVESYPNESASDVSGTASNFVSADVSLNSTYDRPEQKTYIENGPIDKNSTYIIDKNVAHDKIGPPPVAPKPKGIPKPKVYNHSGHNDVSDGNVSSFSSDQASFVDAKSPKDDKNLHNSDMVQQDTQKKVGSSLPVAKKSPAKPQRMNSLEKSNSLDKSETVRKNIFRDDTPERLSRLPEPKVKTNKQTQETNTPTQDLPNTPPPINSKSKLKQPTKVSVHSNDSVSEPSKSVNKQGSKIPMRSPPPTRNSKLKEPQKVLHKQDSKGSNQIKPSRLPTSKSNSTTSDGSITNDESGNKSRDSNGSNKPTRPPPTYSPSYRNSSPTPSKIAQPQFSSFGKASESTQERKQSLK